MGAFVAAYVDLCLVDTRDRKGRPLARESQARQPVKGSSVPRQKLMLQSGDETKVTFRKE